MLREQLARGVADSQELRGGVHDTPINTALMEQQARHAGLEKVTLVQAQMGLARHPVMARGTLPNATSGF